MANYIKSFNFRNGVQVDNDNFIVNAVGRVGIGTTVPEKLLDVRGNAKVVGHITATDASVSGIVTVGSITINGSTGTISATSFSGSAGQSFGDQAVVAIATDGLIAGPTGLTTSSNLGVGTDSTAFELQVGSNPETSTGFGVTSGNVTASGNLKIIGISTLGVTTVTNLTGQQLNVSGISTLGVTTTTDLTVQQLNVSGVSTLGVTTVTDLTGQQLNISGVSTFSDDILIGTGATVGFGTTAYFGDHAKAIFGTDEDLQIYHSGDSSNIKEDGTGNLNIWGDDIYFYNSAGDQFKAKFETGGSVFLYHGNIKKFETTNEGVLVSGGTTTGALSVSGVSTFSDDILIGTAATVGFSTTAYFGDHAKAIFGDSNDLQIYHDEANSYVSDQGTGDLRLSGNVVKFNNQANTATMVKATQDDSVELYYNNSKKFETSNTGVTVTGSIGIGTSAPSADLQIRKASGNATLEVISDTGKASISIGNSVGTGTSSASINYGSTSGFGVYSTEQSFDIINRDTGNVNYFLSNSAPTNSGFRWHKGSSNQLMTLTSDGKLGIGITNPEQPLHVSGISTFTSTVYFGGSVSFADETTIGVTLKGDVQNTSGSVIVDVSEALLNGNVNTTSGISTFNRVSVSSTISSDSLIVDSGTSHSSANHKLSVNSSSSSRFFVAESGAIGISTNVDLDNYPTVGVFSPDRIGIFGGVGVGTTAVRCAVDFADAGTVGVGTTQPYFLPPKVSTTTRNGIGGTVTGATIYNITLNKLQVYTGSAWETLTSS
jgi:hypothetical protein